MPDTYFNCDVKRLMELFISYIYSGSIKQTSNSYFMQGPWLIHSLEEQ